MRFDHLFSLSWKTLAEQLAGQLEADVQQLADFFECLLSDVVCKQVLPDAVKHVSETFSISFCFKPTIVVGEGCSRDIVVSCSHPTFSGIRLAYDSPVNNSIASSPLSSSNFYGLPSSAHQRCMLLLSLLHNIFASDKTSANRLWRICVYYDFIKPGSALADSVIDLPFGTTFYFRLRPFDCVTDLLASLLAAGYDLTSLQPFLAV